MNKNNKSNNKSYHKSLYALFTATALSLFLAACGFHLRGNIPLPPGLDPMFIQTTTPYDPLVQAIEDTLTSSHVKLATSLKSAKTILHILDMKSTENLVSVSTSTNTRQYALTETLQIELTDSTGKVIIPVSTLTASNPLTVDSSQVLNLSSQKQTQVQEMQQALVQQLMARLASKNTKQALGTVRQ